MKWNELHEIAQIEQIVKESESKPVLIFKHSTRCSISASALNRVERVWSDKSEESVKPYYLDLISHRDVSNAIEAKFNVEHQSPQVLMISKGKSVYDTSHSDINLPEIISQAQFVS